MKKHLLAAAVLAFAAGSAMAGPQDGYGNVASNSASSGFVNSQSKALAISSGNGSALSSTQSGAFATFGQITTGPVTNGTASVAGFTQTSEYTTSYSTTAGNALTGASSWNSEGASASSVAPVSEGSVGYGTATGVSNSASGGSAGTFSAFGWNAGAQQGNTASNTGGYTASDSAIKTTGTATVNGVSVPVTTYSTQTSAFANNVSAQTTDSVFSNASGYLYDSANVGLGNNAVYNSGYTAAVAN